MSFTKIFYFLFYFFIVLVLVYNDSNTTLKKEPEPYLKSRISQRPLRTP